MSLRAAHHLCVFCWNREKQILNRSLKGKVYVVGNHTFGTSLQQCSIESSILKNIQSNMVNAKRYKFMCPQIWIWEHVLRYIWRIILPVWTYMLRISGDVSKTQPPFEMKFSDFSFIVYFYIYLGLKHMIWGIAWWGINTYLVCDNIMCVSTGK